MAPIADRTGARGARAGDPRARAARITPRQRRASTSTARRHRVCPLALREIGRLREISFRAVGEGTGNALDLDVFDEHYHHLFVWNRDAREIVGAYRLGFTDQIVATRGIGGLYTSTLFRYDARLLARLGPAIELGRSFVRAEYQRSSNALLLLWKGIARFVTRAGRYRVLLVPSASAAAMATRRSSC